jgi:hypothetical protein
MCLSLNAREASSVQTWLGFIYITRLANLLSGLSSFRVCSSLHIYSDALRTVQNAAMACFTFSKCKTYRRLVLVIPAVIASSAVNASYADHFYSLRASRTCLVFLLLHPSTVCVKLATQPWKRSVGGSLSNSFRQRLCTFFSLSEWPKNSYNVRFPLFWVTARHHVSGCSNTKHNVM